MCRMPPWTCKDGSRISHGSTKVSRIYLVIDLTMGINLRVELVIKRCEMNDVDTAPVSHL